MASLLTMNITSIARVVKSLFVIALAMAALALQASDTLTITFTGDVLLDRGVRKHIVSRNGDANCLFSPSIDSVFAMSQLVVANLECPATKIEKPVFKNYIFRGEPEWLVTLKEHGITHLNLANNHSIDQGREGLIDTRNNIIKAGMIPIGAGETMDEAAMPVLLATAPRNVYMLASLRLALENTSYLPGKPSVSQESFDSLVARVKDLKAHDPGCCVIVSLHWGAEHMLRPAVQQLSQAHQLIDAGADCLICHHTHTMQSIERYKGKSIYYSIGNFIFDQQRDINSRACMVQLTITSHDIEANTIPVIIKNCVPEVE
ncbi:MAG: CapA family protein [Muribaculaceae bacterium]|nr:CapA family protein [Muribaculaceae bacterium]